MPDDIAPALRDELGKALASMEPQLRGLNDLAKTSISQDLRNEVDVQIEIRERRGVRIRTVLLLLDSIDEAMAFLKKDGYPNLEGAPLPEFLFTELGEENSDFAAAIAVFKPDDAQNISVQLGASAPKPSKEKT